MVSHEPFGSASPVLKIGPTPLATDNAQTTLQRISQKQRVQNVRLTHAEHGKSTVC